MRARSGQVNTDVVSSIQQQWNIKKQWSHNFFNTVSRCSWLIARVHIKYNNYTSISFLPSVLSLFCLGKSNAAKTTSTKPQFPWSHFTSCTFLCLSKMLSLVWFGTQISVTSLGSWGSLSGNGCVHITGAKSWNQMLHLQPPLSPIKHSDLSQPLNAMLLL